MVAIIIIALIIIAVLIGILAFVAGVHIGVAGTITALDTTTIDALKHDMLN